MRILRDKNFVDGVKAMRGIALLWPNCVSETEWAAAKSLPRPQGNVMAANLHL